MQMPTISLARMAMCESVATSCCYRAVTTENATYWEVLSGGWVGNSYVNNITRRPEYETLHKSWLDYPYDILFAGSANPTEMRNPVANADVLLPGAESPTRDWYVYNPDGGLIGTLTEFLTQTPTRQPPFRATTPCNHTDGSCAYFTADPTFVEGGHFDAERYHDTGGNDWRKPHEAQQFSS